MIRRDELISKLEQLGFKIFTPRSKAWKYALIFSNEAHSLCILVGKINIDFRYYDEIKDFKLDEKGLLYTDGGLLVRNYYVESNTPIHEHIIKIANLFVSNSKIEASLLEPNGITGTQQKREYNRKNIPTNFYDELGIGDGEDVYLCDGVWLCSDGSTYEQ